MFPIRCYTCNCVLAQFAHDYKQAAASNRVKDFFESRGITRMCCRRMFLADVVTTTETQLEYPRVDVPLDSGMLKRHSQVVSDVSCD